MEIKLFEIRNMKEALENFVYREVPIKAGLKLAKLIKLLNVELTRIERFRIDLVKKLGVVNEETQEIYVPSEKNEEFMREFNDFLFTSVTIDFDPIDAQIFEDCKVPVADLILLDKIFK